MSRWLGRVVNVGGMLTLTAVFALALIWWNRGDRTRVTDITDSHSPKNRALNDNKRPERGTFRDEQRPSADNSPKQRHLPDRMTWINAKNNVDRTEITSTMKHNDAELAMYRYMKRLQIKCPRWVRIGTKQDGGWFVCIAGPYDIKKSACLVYSFGLGPNWSFDYVITEKYGCTDMAYDPTLGKPDHTPNPRFFYHNTGLAGLDSDSYNGWRVRTIPTLLKDNGHSNSTIDILKIDVEGSEWSALDAMFATPRCLDRVKQLAIEVHMKRDRDTIDDFRRYVDAGRRLDGLGFKIWNTKNNIGCKFRLHGQKLWSCFNVYYLNVNYLADEHKR